jgi:hypothetical protein
MFSLCQRKRGVRFCRLGQNSLTLVHLWYICGWGDGCDRKRKSHATPNDGQPRKNEILFTDGRNLGHLINRRTRELSPEDIQKIADTYHAWLVGADCIRPDSVDTHQ